MNWLINCAKEKNSYYNIYYLAIFFMYIDTHFHPYLCEKQSFSDLKAKFTSSWGKFMNAIWVDIETSKKCIELASNHSEVYAVIGIHPCYIWFDWESIDDFIKELESKENLLDLVWWLEELIKTSDKIVWIGECWLDYHRYSSIVETNSIDHEKIKIIQKYYFKAQILLAQKYNLPFIIHTRNAAQDSLELIKEMNYKNFVVHCFSEDLSFAQACLDFAPNAMISFSGIVTFKSAKSVQETAQNIPLTNILIETDSPYLTPTPHRWKEENEPAFTKHVLDFIQDLRHESDEEIEKQIYENSVKFFWFTC